MDRQEDFLNCRCTLLNSNNSLRGEDPQKLLKDHKEQNTRYLIQIMGHVQEWKTPVSKELETHSDIALIVVGSLQTKKRKCKIKIDGQRKLNVKLQIIKSTTTKNTFSKSNINNNFAFQLLRNYISKAEKQYLYPTLSWQPKRPNTHKNNKKTFFFEKNHQLDRYPTK